MDFFLFSLSLFPLFAVLVSGISFTQFIYPNFTASHIKFIDDSGSFLRSSNGEFKVSMFNPGAQTTRFYLCVLHAQSNTVIWTGNRDQPVSESGTMSLTSDGISIREGDSLKWSTPFFVSSSISAMQITEKGNLVLLDRSNFTIWDTFGNPTDTIVIGQQLKLKTVLVSRVSGDDLSTGSYELSVTGSDIVLQWENITYWKLSMESMAYVNSNMAVEYMGINQTGVFLFGKNGSVVVLEVNLPMSPFRIARIDESGQFIVSSFSGATEKQDFSGPVNGCSIPLVCGKIGLCTAGASVNSPVCSCPLGFHATANDSTRCVPADSEYSLPGSCVYSNLLYLPLGNAVDYFANDFTAPVEYGVSLSRCKDLCSRDCGCVGVFHDNSSGYCYKLENKIGSVMMRATSNGRLGFVKAVIKAPRTNYTDSGGDRDGFPRIAAVMLPLSAVLFLFGIGILLWRRKRQLEIRKKLVGFLKYSSSSGDYEFAIPGLPLRFEYEELETATENFKTRIGTGGFGTVYKGILPDKTLVAVKRITNLGVRGKRDFCTEIAVIGNIHHVNLVKLKGYCAKRRQWLLVYEYMNRGSLDKTLFGNGPVLEWQERVEIAIDAARGLAYLHTGCEHKIVHCDVKPENILLHDNFHAKISDFGLSKLLGREQSGLFTTMRGTRGYLAPEWLTSSAVSEKTDVYSFGMVLFEIVSGRKNCTIRTQSHSLEHEKSTSSGNSTSSSVQGLVYFPLYALEMHEQCKYMELVDPRLQGRATEEDVEKLVRIALCCVHEEPRLRPAMVSVVGMLEGEMPLPEPRIESLNFLRFYGRRFAEASMAEETQTEVVIHPSVGTFDSSSCTSHASNNVCLSYISSQQISGPR